jgi:leucyl aminopeptidase
MKWTIRSAWEPFPACDALVLFCRRDKRERVVCDDRGGMPRQMARLADGWLAGHSWSGRADKAVEIPTWLKKGPRHLILAGLGDEPIPARGFETAAAAAAKLARMSDWSDLVFFLPSEAEAGPAALARRVVRGAHLGAYAFRTCKPITARPATLKRMTLLAPTEDKAAVAPIRRAVAEGGAEGATLDEIRDLANLPGNVATPSHVAAVAKRLAKTHGLRFRRLGPEEMYSEGMHALLGVARGSSQEPCLIVLEYAGLRRAKPVVMVGKTVTFDAGGLSLKPPKGMEKMYSDKSGGMAVLAAIVAAARLRLPHPAVAVLPAVENMPDGRAQRPGDIVRSHLGDSIQVLNTDAEGRLILADALSWSARFKPRAMVDVATLTGAASVALGSHAAALLSRDDALAGALRAAGERSGDRVWPLPLWPEYDADLESEFADLKNIGDGNAGTIIGGAFLRNFAPEGVPWAHLDIAGMAWKDSGSASRAPGATLFGARLLVDWMEHLDV